ncbi:hypothetical protein KUTeg_021869, partial [Tegillarca granosa]
MFCTYCKEFWGGKELKELAKIWVNVTSNFKIDSVKSHEITQMHKDALKAEKKNKTNVRQSEAGKALRQLNKAEYDKVSLRFRNAHAIAKHDKSFKDFIWLCNLDEAKGLDTGVTYKNDKSARLFVKHIANVETEKNKSFLSKSLYFSITIDGAMDVAGDEQESIYLHSALKGVRQQRFLKFVSPESTTSEDIHAAIVEALRDDEIDMAKLVGITSDGASNMFGIKKGYSTAKKSHPEIVTTHCLAHRMELAVKSAVKQVSNKLYDRAMTLPLSLYYLYKKSSKQKKQLVRTFKICKLPCVLPMRVGDSRWVPHTIAAINAFFRRYQAIVMQLDNASHGNPKDEGLSNMAQDMNIKTYLMVLKELLGPLNNLSLFLQRDDTTLADAYLMLESTKDNIQTYGNDNSTQLKDLCETGMYKGRKLKGQSPKLAYRAEFVKAIVGSLENRFSTDHVLLKATQIANFRIWPPAKEKDKIHDFGFDVVQMLTNHFTSRFPDEKSVQSEWRSLKSILYQRQKSRNIHLQRNFLGNKKQTKAHKKKEKEHKTKHIQMKNKTLDQWLYCPDIEDFAAICQNGLDEHLQQNLPLIKWIWRQ